MWRRFAAADKGFFSRNKAIGEAALDGEDHERAPDRAGAQGVARLEATDLAAIRGGRRVFAGCSFALAAGALALLKGPNGSGKSSLLRVLAGLAPAEQGEAAVRLGDGTRLTLQKQRDAYVERLAYAGHLDALKPSLGVAENLTFWARLMGLDRTMAAARVRDALARFGLDALAETPAGLCSAGQKRRLGLARLAVVDRAIWLLDEPTVSLDAASVDTFGALLAEHLAGGGVAVAATHIALPTPAAVTLDMAAFAPIAGQSDGGAASADPFLDGESW